MNRIISSSCLVVLLAGCGGGGNEEHAYIHPLTDQLQTVDSDINLPLTPADAVQIQADMDATMARLHFLYPDWQGNEAYAKKGLQPSEIASVDDAQRVIDQFYQDCPKCKPME